MSINPSRIANNLAHRSPPHACAPGGEDRGEGELNLCGPMSALILILTSDFWILNSGHPPFSFLIRHSRIYTFPPIYL